MQRRLGRLSGRDRFSAILAQRNSARASYLQLYVGSVDENARPNAHLGVGIAKALAKRATERNYMRRVLREEMRKLEQQLPPLPMVILVRKGFDRRSRSDAVAELHTLVLKLKLCAAC